MSHEYFKENLEAIKAESQIKQMEKRFNVSKYDIRR